MLNDNAPIRVLVVEDEQLIAMMTEDMLEEIGCRVVATAHSLSSAVELAQSVEMDLAVLDVNLKGQESYPVADQLRKQGVPVIFLTGFGERGIAERFKEVPVLTKPFTQDALREMVMSLK